jgi:hypothetical protein
VKRDDFALASFLARTMMDDDETSATMAIVHLGKRHAEAFKKYGLVYQLPPYTSHH